MRDVLLDVIHARLNFGGRRRRVGHALALGPRGKRCLELCQHVLGFEVAAHGDDHIARIEHARGERGHVTLGDGTNRGLGRLARFKVVLAIQRHVPLAAEDRISVVVALLHLLKHVIDGDLLLRFVKARPANHVHHERKAFVEVCLEAVDRRSADGGAGTDRDFGCEEIKSFVELRRRQAFSSARAHQVGGHSREPNFVGGFEVVAALERHRKIDERELFARREEHDDAVGKHMPIVGGLRWVEGERLEFDLLGTSGHGLRRSGNHSDSSEDGEREDGGGGVHDLLHDVLHDLLDALLDGVSVHFFASSSARRASILARMKSKSGFICGGICSA